MDCQEVSQLRPGYIARELGDAVVQEILEHLDHCQACHEAYMSAIGGEVAETLERGPVLTRFLSADEIDEERIERMRRSAHGDIPHPWPMEDFNYRAFMPAEDDAGSSGWWLSERTLPLERAAWEVTLALPTGRHTGALLLLLSLGGLYDWESTPTLECPVRYRKPPDWFLIGRSRHPLVPIWAVVSVTALLGQLRRLHGRRRLRAAARHAAMQWLHARPA